MEHRKRETEMESKNTASRKAEAQNLLWRWYSHLGGAKAFEESFPAQRCDDPLWRAMAAAVRDHDQPSTRPAPGEFDFRTFTVRLHLVANSERIPDDALSPAAITMVQYAAKGYAAQDIPKGTRDAMIAWLRERGHILVTIEPVREIARTFNVSHSTISRLKV